MRINPLIDARSFCRVYQQVFCGSIAKITMMIVAAIVYMYGDVRERQANHQATLQIRQVLPAVLQIPRLAVLQIHRPVANQIVHKVVTLRVLRQVTLRVTLPVTLRVARYPVTLHPVILLVLHQVTHHLVPHLV